MNARAGAAEERRLWKRKIKAVFKNLYKTYSKIVQVNLDDVLANIGDSELAKAEKELLAYADGRVARYRKKAKGL